MSWTYDSGLGTPRDLVRFYIGDTDIDDPQLQDEEIDALLLVNSPNTPPTNNTALLAATDAVRGLIAKYSRFADKWVGDLKILASQRIASYSALLDRLNELSAQSRLGLAGVPTAGGVYSGEKDTMARRSDIVHPNFRIGQNDNPTAP